MTGARNDSDPFDPRPPLLKRFGQHHLHQPEVCAPLLDYLQPAGSLVVEIGPGGGVLTAELLRVGSRVLALELDVAWAFYLMRRRHRPGLRVVIGDALDTMWARLPPRSMVTGNLPFNVATAIIEALLPCHNQIPRAAFLVQKEVADRLVAKPGEPAYGSLSVLTAAWAVPTPLGRVRRGSFRPPPKVDGAFVGLDLIEPPLPHDEMSELSQTVHAAFAQRRKQLRNSLAGAWGRQRAEAALEAAGLRPEGRAEELSLRDFVALHQAFVANGRTSDRSDR